MTDDPGFVDGRNGLRRRGSRLGSGVDFGPRHDVAMGKSGGSAQGQSGTDERQNHEFVHEYSPSEIPTSIHQAISIFYPSAMTAAMQNET
jgi:hypothetical protein